MLSRLSSQSSREPIRKKAFEVSYALFRVAAVVKSRSFAETLEANAISILDGAVIFRYKSVESLLESTAYLLRFGSEAGIVHPRNADMLLKEMGNLDFLVKKALQEENKLPEADFSGIFSKSVPGKSAVPAKSTSDSGNDTIAGNNVRSEKPLPEKAGIRQSAILERIRQFSNSATSGTSCRISDLQEAFPEISERTLRYDLEYLIGEGFLERVGSGKATSYQVKTGPQTLISLPGSAQEQTAASLGSEVQ